MVSVSFAVEAELEAEVEPLVEEQPTAPASARTLAAPTKLLLVKAV
jgi:isopenicillin N synthase-like dioxygenase